MMKYSVVLALTILAIFAHVVEMRHHKHKPKQSAHIPPIPQPLEPTGVTPVAAPPNNDIKPIPKIPRIPTIPTVPTINHPLPPKFDSSQPWSTSSYGSTTQITKKILKHKHKHVYFLPSYSGSSTKSI